MDDPANPPLNIGFAAAMEWWRDAGVDSIFHDEPTRWLAPSDHAAGQAQQQPAFPPPSVSSSAQPATEALAAAPDRSSWPGELPAFAEWWLSEAWLDNGRMEGRVAPRGQQGAELMVIVPEPEREDREMLLSGPQGRLLDAILSAMGLSPEEAYVASALPRYTPMADWAALARRGMGEVLSHHVKLARPKRLIAFGGNILPLFGNNPAQQPAILQNFNHEGVTIPLLAARDLAALLERPRWKAGLWQTWLEWTALEWTAPASQADG